MASWQVANEFALFLTIGSGHVLTCMQTDDATAALSFQEQNTIIEQNCSQIQHNKLNIK